MTSIIICVEWQMIDIGLQSYQKVSVSLYDTLGKDSVGMHLVPQSNELFTHRFVQPTCKITSSVVVSCILTCSPSIEHAHLSIIFATSDHIATLLKLAPSLPMLKYLICIDTLTVDASKILRAWAQSLNVRFSEFAECKFHHHHHHDSDSLTMSICAVEAFGKENLVEPIPAYPDLVASICYTSVSFYVLADCLVFKLSVGNHQQPQRWEKNAIH